MHGKTIFRIAKDMKRSYSTIHGIVNSFLKYGAINRLRNYKEKVSIILFRKSKQISKENKVAKRGIARVARKN